MILCGKIGAFIPQNLTKYKNYAILIISSKLNKLSLGVRDMARNYISNIRALGISTRKMAKALSVTQKQVRGWELSPPKSSSPAYEAIRNLSRRTTYQTLRAAGYTSKQASGWRRVHEVEALADVDWLQGQIDRLYGEWNFSYNAYMANPDGWVAAHPNKAIPEHITKSEIRKRLQYGIDHNQRSKEELENY